MLEVSANLAKSRFRSVAPLASNTTCFYVLLPVGGAVLTVWLWAISVAHHMFMMLDHLVAPDPLNFVLLLRWRLYALLGDLSV